jgi:hypothetical protein
MDRPPKEMHSTRKEIISTSGVIISHSHAKYLPYILIQKSWFQFLMSQLRLGKANRFVSQWITWKMEKVESISGLAAQHML